jgi:serine/threonine-protein kinase
MMLAAAGHAYASSGKREAAEKILGELCCPPASRYVAPVYPALVAAGLGNEALAFDELDRAVKERSGWIVFLRVDPRFDCLRNSARFQQIVERTGILADGSGRDSSGSTQRRAG